jgi:carboxyl-terminal processing protease
MKKYIALLAAVAATVAALAQPPVIPDSVTAGQVRVDEVMRLIDGNYVEGPDMDKMSTEAINAMLKALDPHSVYIAAKDVQRANEGLQGNFEGVGISFQIVSDTIVVQSVIEGGPSEKVGVQVGDKLLTIDGEKATGDTIDNNFVFKRLRGKKGTEVVIDMLRDGTVYTFHIIRDRVPIYSIDTYFMANDTVGYIRLTRFARTSVDEFRKAVKELRKQGMTALMLDLRGNTGGYLDIANAMANEFLERGQLIVYTKGRISPRHNYTANGRGNWRSGRLVVMIDEGSASASEIVSGAVQDWDRGILIGRRTFGKGLVQRMFELSDGSQVRITTARYYTPSGRCIQKPYSTGTADYNNELSNRYKHGELFSVDSIHFPDSLKYTTHGGRTVYGGGGIMPDLFIPLDTTPASKYYQVCRRKGLLNQFPQYYADHHRADTLIADFDAFLRNYPQLQLDSVFDAFAASKGVYRDSIQETATDSIVQFNAHFLSLQVKALVADRLYGRGHYYRIMKDEDKFYQAALVELRKKKK